ncbi:MAG: N-acetylmuramoyl-L-alanine amidase [Nitrospirae bacterium]|nr:N-acetylmuramoyl-L-alanine amidase [Nitrospirota bacterium]
MEALRGKLQRLKFAAVLAIACALYILALSPSFFSVCEAAYPLNEIKDIRYFASTNYIRVVLDLALDGKFRNNELKEFRKMYVDLENSRLGALSKKTIYIDNSIIKRVRVGQFEPTTVRVVFDLGDFKEYKIFTMSDPARIIIDVYGIDETNATVSGTNTGETNKGEEYHSNTERSTPSQYVHGQDEPAGETGSRETKSHKELPREGPSKEPASLNNHAIEKQPEKPQEKTQEKQSARSPEKTSEKPQVSMQPNTSIQPPSDSGNQTIATARAKSTPLEKNKTVKKFKGTAGEKGKGKGKNEDIAFARKKIVLDPGHGGHDPGAMSKDGLKEKDITLDIALYTAKILRNKYGFDVYMTRDKDVFIPLDERTAIANSKNADLFVSIHVNANNTPSVKGIETYFLNFTNSEESMKVAARENDISMKKMKKLQSELGIILASLARETKRDESLRLAHILQDAIVSNLKKKYKGVCNNGVKKGPFYVLVGASMPSALVEVSYITNENEEKLLNSDSYKQDMALSIARGINQYVMSLPESPEYAKLGKVRSEAD